MTGPYRADWAARVRAIRPGEQATRTAHCLNDDALAALAEGTLDSESRSAALAHVAECPRCRRAVASVTRALADPGVAREARTARRVGRRRAQPLWRLAGFAAAAAAVVLIAWPRQHEEPLPHRASPITAAPGAEAVWPVGPVAEARSLRWTPVSGADRYRVALFDADGSIRYEAELAGTEVTLPDSVLAAPGETYWWTVDARLGFDRWASSELIEFSIERGPRR